jgi:hypothetical protein
MAGFIEDYAMCRGLAARTAEQIARIHGGRPKYRANHDLVEGHTRWDCCGDSLLTGLCQRILRMKCGWDRRRLLPLRELEPERPNV